MFKKFVQALKSWRSTLIGASIGLGLVLHGLEILTTEVTFVLGGVIAFLMIISKDAE